MLPISLAVGLLRWSGQLDRLSGWFAPAMALFRLPGEAALPLASAWFGGIYALLGAMAMLPLSATAVTVLGAMGLVAHNLIVECAVQDRAGTPWWWVLATRLLASVLVGAIVAWSIAALEALRWPALWLRWTPGTGPAAIPSGGSLAVFLAGWAGEALRLMIKVALIVTGLMVATEWMRMTGFIERLQRGARPLLRGFGLSEQVAFPWLTAQIVGVAFGSGLLIEELRERDHDPRVVRALHTSIGIQHSLLEDTILVAAAGASLFWIIVPRALAAALAVRWIGPLPWGLRGAAAALRAGARGAAPRTSRPTPP
jgi:spore maturation protein SpmB